ncbi:MAG TPA: nucleotidyl transferase AbiEii/AbiGii toxin family protein [Conexibacter sp.]|nr:nucleotidyl transferase AbiEii/AbiGii toxin family protein [Conexibacter sp.]
MSLPDGLGAVLPPETARAWSELAPLLPSGAYLAGGTGLAAHIHHRVSRDLDLFSHQAIDLDALRERLTATGTFAATRIGDGVLDGVLAGAKVQFLHARDQRRLAPTCRIAGIPVAAVEDILAMKLKVIGDRGELRDYFDVMAIEQQLGRTAEEGIALYLERFQVPAEHESVRHILRGLGYLDDVDDDELLPVGRAEIERYWWRRQPQVVRNASRFG